MTAVNATKCIRLRASFILVPAPIGPACTTLEPIASSAGRAAANASSDPPTMIASVPSAAPIAPPLTGASSTFTPCRAAVSASWAGVAGATVEWMTDGEPVSGDPEHLAEHVAHLVVVAHHHAEHVDPGRQLGHAGGALAPAAASSATGPGATS